MGCGRVCMRVAVGKMLLYSVNLLWVVVALLAHFTNTIDAFYLLGRVFWCGSEFIAFTTHNRFTEYTNIFPTATRMHTLPYPIDNAPEE